MTELRRVPLSTGVTLNVALAGPEDAPPVILLHGFPESHRTWRGIAPLLENRFRLIMPDLRGFGASDQPQEVEAYSTDRVVADIFALADALRIDRFSLVGHDWGGATAWASAIRGNPRLERLAIVNSPHPLVFQRSLIESAEQRAGSQYINVFRTSGFERAIEAMGYEKFFTKTFTPHVDVEAIPPEERARYVADWSKPGAMTAMLNWYRASQLIVPKPDETEEMPAWVGRGLPKIEIPVLVIWGMKDRALLPLQLDGLDEHCADLTIVRLPQTGHFAPWEVAEEVAAALTPFLAGEEAATGRAQ